MMKIVLELWSPHCQTCYESYIIILLSGLRKGNHLLPSGDFNQGNHLRFHIISYLTNEIRLLYSIAFLRAQSVSLVQSSLFESSAEVHNQMTSQFEYFVVVHYYIRPDIF